MKGELFYFISRTGSCRFGKTCKFLHHGVSQPHLKAKNSRKDLNNNVPAKPKPKPIYLNDYKRGEDIKKRRRKIHPRNKDTLEDVYDRPSSLKQVWPTFCNLWDQHWAWTKLLLFLTFSWRHFEMHFLERSFFYGEFQLKFHWSLLVLSMVQYIVNTCMSASVLSMQIHALFGEKKENDILSTYFFPKCPKFCKRHFQMHIFQFFYFSMKIVIFWYKFRWNLFPRISITTSQHWFRNGLVPKRWQAIIWSNDGIVYWRIYASLSHNELTHWSLAYAICMTYSVIEMGQYITVKTLV